jgi:hypothetical protein
MYRTNVKVIVSSGKVSQPYFHEGNPKINIYFSGTPVLEYFRSGVLVAEIAVNSLLN